MKIPKDAGWMLFGIILLVILVWLEKGPDRFIFIPKFMILLYVSSAVLSYVLGALLKKTYHLTKEPAKFFFAMGLQAMGVFWFAAAALSPSTLSSQSGMFLWAPYLGLIFASVLFLGGIIPRSKNVETYLYKHHSDIQELVTATIFALAILLLAGPWGARTAPVLEEGSFPGGELVLIGILVVAVLLIFALQYYHDSFKGFNYDALSRGLLFLTVAQYGLLIKQPWSLQWWVLHLSAYGTLCMLSYKLRAEVKTQSTILESVTRWQPMPVNTTPKLKNSARKTA